MAAGRGIMSQRMKTLLAILVATLACAQSPDAPKEESL